MCGGDFVPKYDHLCVGEILSLSTTNHVVEGFCPNVSMTNYVAGDFVPMYDQSQCGEILSTFMTHYVAGGFCPHK